MKKIRHSIRKVFREEADKNDEDGMPVESCRPGVTEHPCQAEHISTTAREPEQDLEQPKTMATETMAGEQLSR